MDVATWLHGLGLEQYEQAFRENDIDAEVLTDLTAEDLIGLGVTSIGHRRKFLAAIATLRVDPSPQAGSPKGASGPPSGSALPPPMAERRQITVLFYDLVGSTALATRQDPEDVREALSAFHRRIGEGVVRFGGFVARTMGDGALAYFGYPQAHEDDAERAVRAGLAAIDAVAGLTLPDGRAAQVRIGIATGLAVVGEINGIGRTPEDDIAGETPNLAARLQTIAKPDEIVVAASTRRLVGDLFEFHDLGAVEVKGFAEPVRAWRVLGASMVASRFEALHGSYGFTPLIGRAEETELLLRRWTLAKSGEGRVVLLSGEPGIGKSRIAAAVEEAIRNEPHVRLHYYCSPHHTGSALYPIASQLERAAGFGREDTVDTKLTKLETLLAKSATSAEDIALLAELSSLPAEGRYPPLGLSPKQKRVRTLTALLRQLDTLSRRCPVLMLFEDAHWADPTSLEVLNLAVERAQRLPVLILVTFRPEFRPPWIGQPHVTALTIARLQRSEGAALAELVAGKQLPADILDQIVTRTDGVPLFLEELTKAVLESGLLREQDGCHVLDRPPQGLVIPTSLQASLIARLDRLAPEKDVIQTGAAIGREFSYEVLAAVVALPEDHLRTALERLVSAELIFARGTPPDATYLFKHALVQDAAYATLLRSRRQQLHARIAAVLEEHFADVVEAQPEILAHHCAQARLSAKAIAYGQKAGDLAIRRSAMTEAIGHLTRALDLLETLPDDRQRDTFEFRLQLARAGALLQASGWASPQMGEAYSRARELSRKLDDIPELEVVLALFGQWTFHHNRAELDTAREIADELMFLKTMHAGALTPALAHRAIGSGLMFRGQFENARTELELALSYYEPSVHEAPTFFGSANTRVVALSFMAWIRLFQGDIAAAHTASREALERARDLTSPYSLAFTVHTKCLFNQVVGNPSSVQDYSAQLVALATEQGYRHLLATATFFQGWAAFVEGHIELGVANMQRGLAAKREGGAEIKVPYYLGLLAESYRQLGRAGDALLLLTDALDRVERTGERWFEAELHRLKAEVLMGHPACSGVGTEAEASLVRALSIARAQAARLWELRASASLARLWRDQGRHADARELLAPVLGRFTKGVDQPDLRHAWELLDTVRQ